MSRDHESRHAALWKGNTALLSLQVIEGLTLLSWVNLNCPACLTLLFRTSQCMCITIRGFNDVVILSMTREGINAACIWNRGQCEDLLKSTGALTCILLVFFYTRGNHWSLLPNNFSRCMACSSTQRMSRRLVRWIPFLFSGRFGASLWNNPSGPIHLHSIFCMW